MAEPDPLAHRPFRCQLTKDGRVRIAYEGRWVVTLAGAEAAKFRSRIADADDAAAQQLMARATGNFRRGNERPVDRG